jgi:hypothetical protein
MDSQRPCLPSRCRPFRPPDARVYRSLRSMQRPNLGRLEQPKRREADLFAMRQGCFEKPVMTGRYKGRSGFKEIARLYPYVVEIVVPPGGLGRRLDDMHEFHRQRGIKDQRGPRRRDDEHDYLRWCFADLATAEAFAAQFGGEILQQKSRPHF